MKSSSDIICTIDHIATSSDIATTCINIPEPMRGQNRLINVLYKQKSTTANLIIITDGQNNSHEQNNKYVNVVQFRL